jgi:alkanesulfonate monooxygenase SsuD/methylene tetrahydromethanopterin reductase-like flavin-dependent oxidoreductase (luciferase family)
VNIGASLRSGFEPMDVRVGARWTIERARAVAAAALDSLFVGDHHAVPFPYYQNVPMMGRLIAEWDTRPCGVLMLLPLWNPVLAAEQIGTLASIAQGPFVLQCAVGGGEYQFKAMGASIHERGARFESALVKIKALCAGEEVDGVRIAPVPPDPLEVWIGASAPKAIDRAARLGDAFLIGPEATVPEVTRLIEIYRDACARHGCDASRIAIRRDVHVGADETDADRVAGPVLARGYRGFDPSAPVVGSPAKVTDAFAQLHELGCTDVIVRHLADDQNEVLKSYERLGTVREQVRAL